MGLALLAVGAGGGWLAARQSAALRRLGREGAAMEGVALGVGPAHGAGAWWFALRYAVVGPDGVRRLGASRPDSRAAFAGVRRGDRVAVLADPAEPARFALARDVERETGERETGKRETGKRETRARKTEARETGAPDASA
jgi:hypothetical protein